MRLAPFLCLLPFVFGACVVPTDGDSTEPECTTDTVGATFQLDASAVEGYTGGQGELSQSDCEAECVSQVMLAYPDTEPSLCELESQGTDGSQTYYCEWQAIVSCP